MVDFILFYDIWMKDYIDGFILFLHQWVYLFFFFLYLFALDNSWHPLDGYLWWLICCLHVPTWTFDYLQTDTPSRGSVRIRGTQLCTWSVTHITYVFVNCEWRQITSALGVGKRIGGWESSSRKDEIERHVNADRTVNPIDLTISQLNQSLYWLPVISHRARISPSYVFIKVVCEIMIDYLSIWHIPSKDRSQKSN